MPVVIDANGGSVLGLEAVINDTDTYYVALFTDPPSDDGGGTEVSVSGYARVAFTDWETSGDDIRQNASLLSFANFTEDETVRAWGIYTAASGGTLLVWDAIQNSEGFPAGILVESGDNPEFPAQELRIVLTSCVDEVG